MNIKKMKYLQLLLPILMILIAWGCEDITDQDKYKDPPWMEGKIYTQITNEEDLSTFLSCLDKTAYDSILDVSGSYTVFAPTDEAFNQFFQDHPVYNSVEDIPDKELKHLVEYQIIFNSWNREQFKSLDIGGWINPNNPNSKPRAYKRQTLVRQDNREYPVKIRGENYSIAPPSESEKTITAYTRSNKYVPIFFQEFLDLQDLSAADYEFYFDRPFESSKLYYAGAELGDQIPAQNGFVYKIDRVVTPLPSGEEILESEYNGQTYSKFLGLVNQFSEFDENIEATNEQPGADEGDVETLYDLNYPGLVFNIHNELTGNTNNPLYTVREHHGLMAPTDEAFESFMDEYLKSWNDIEDLPRTIRELLVSSHMTGDALYSSDVNKGFRNSLKERVSLNEDDIVQTTYGSNCSFIGLNKAILPRAFTSVCRPMYLTREYEIMRYAVNTTNVISRLKEPNENYVFYLPADRYIGDAFDADSSLVLNEIDADLGRYSLRSYDRQEETFVSADLYELRKKILNHIGTTPPDGLADKEFIKNLGGNYIIVNNKEGTINGTAPSTFGYNGDSTITIQAEPYLEEMDNGEVYTINGWFDFNRGNDYYAYFKLQYPKFFDLLEKAGLYDPTYYDYPFLLEGRPYTVFVPTDQALEDYGADNLPQDELKKFLKYHFVQKELIFTDGKKPNRLYETTRLSESSTPYSTINSKLPIRPRPDVIQILDKNGGVYLEVPEEEGETNIMIGYDTDKRPNRDSKWDYITTGVIHTIDKVLVKDSLQAK